jgi:LPS export ABC transporter protein LptC
MTFGQIRLIKWTLFAVLIGFGGYVALSVWRGVRDNKGAVDLPQAESANLVSKQVAIEQLDSDGNTAWTLKAAESTGRSESAQDFRDVEIHFGAGKENKPLTITADYCRINKDRSVHLENNVVVRDETSLRLEGDSLDFRRGPDMVWSTKPVRYFKEGLEGDAGNFRYLTVRGTLLLHEGVSMVLQEEGDQPVRIQSKRAEMRKWRNHAQFVDAVRVRQGRRSLSCNDLQLFFVDGTEEIEHLEAFENVELRMNVPAKEEGAEVQSEGQPAAALSREPGLKRLLTDRLEVFYRPGGKLLERARALEGGRLLMTLPEGATEGYDKELEGYTLVFGFDEEGRLTSLLGRGGVTLLLTPVGEGEPKKVTARQLEADFDAESGELLEARCERSVEFEQGGIRATAEQGTFRPAESKLYLRETPRLWDEKVSLEASEIRIDVDSGDVEGIGNVRSTSAGEGEAGLFPATASAPVHFVGEHLDYDRAKDLAIYDGEARAFQGKSRIEADRIQIEQAKGELLAEGHVTTIFLQNLAEDGKAGEPTVTRAEQLRYRSETEVLEYRRRVVMRSKGMTVRGKSVDVMLETGGSEVREVVARENVEIETSEGQAGGEQARFLPKEDSMTVTGADAWLKNAGKLTEGKQLTFFLSDDRILVDGQEQNRTKTTYSSNPRPF